MRRPTINKYILWPDWSDNDDERVNTRTIKSGEPLCYTVRIYFITDTRMPWGDARASDSEQRHIDAGREIRSWIRSGQYLLYTASIQLVQLRNICKRRAFKRLQKYIPPASVFPPVFRELVFWINQSHVHFFLLFPYLPISDVIKLAFLAAEVGCN